VVVQIKALACELPATLGLPLSRLSVPDIASEAVRRGIVATISDTTVWRWLASDAIRPWTFRSWIFPRDPERRILAFERRYEEAARPFEWKFTREDLARLLRRLDQKEPLPAAA
jgi:hypothetical protein